MDDTDSDVIVIVTERFERRLTEESSRLRVEMATEFGKVRNEMATEFGKVRAEMANGFGDVRTEIAQLRAEMIDRNADLLKWGLVFGVTQTAAIAGIVALVR
ncbi:MAG: hypothetical protein AB7P34_11680 [Vicinamibacterales bacterium]